MTRTVTTAARTFVYALGPNGSLAAKICNSRAEVSKFKEMYCPRYDSFFSRVIA